MHKVKEILSNLHRQPLDPLLGGDIKRGKRGEVLDRDADLGGEGGVAGGREAHLTAASGLWPGEAEDGGGAAESDGATEEKRRSWRLDVDGEGFIGGEREGVEEEDAELADLVVGLADESVHVEDPMECVDLGEGGDVHWEAPIGKHYSEHFFLVTSLSLLS